MRVNIEVGFMVEAHDVEAAEDILRDALDRNLAEVEPVRWIGPVKAVER